MSRPAARQWLRRHNADAFVAQARRDGYRSRAVYKLREMDQRACLLRPGLRVLDLGAAPGGWSQYAQQRVAPGGVVIAVDLRPLAPLDGIHVVQGDAASASVRRRIAALAASAAPGTPAAPGDHAGVDLVLSDMAPDLSGVAATDQARGLALAATAVELALALLHPPGALLLKFFEGAESTALRCRCRAAFEQVRAMKPGASRPGSREQYLLCRRLKKP